MKLSNILIFGISLCISCSTAVPISDVDTQPSEVKSPLPSTSVVAFINDKVIGGHTDWGAGGSEETVAGDKISGHWHECTMALVGPNQDDALVSLRYSYRV